MLYVFQCCTCSNVVRVLIPFNNKEILIHGKPFFWKEWFKKGIRTIKDLLDKNENVLPAWCKEMESNRSYGPRKTNWTNIFKSVQKTCRTDRVREFHFKFIHRIVVNKAELFRFDIKSDSHCIYCRDLDSIDNTFLECQFTKSFTEEVLMF